jgi:hypothetical protein
MITLKDFMQVTDYRITEGSDYGWSCYGNNAYTLDSWNGDNDKGHSIVVTFDRVTQEVYEAQIHDYRNERGYRLFNPAYKAAHDAEAESRNVSHKEAWDEVDYVDLDVDSDFMEKAAAVVADEDYDTRIKISVDLPEEDLFALMKMAHEKDVTFNSFLESVLRDELIRVGAWSEDDDEA